MVIRGSQSNAKKWMDTYKFPYPLLLDPQLNLFKELGLKRAIKGVVKFSNLNYYAEKRIAGVPFTTPYDGDDIHLMAGDYITDSSGKLVFAYNAVEAFDRPSTDQILRALDGTLVN